MWTLFIPSVHAKCEISVFLTRTFYQNLTVRPSITGISRNQTWNETNDVTLSCNATGKPPPNVTWSSSGNKDMTYLGPVLTLKNISREQDDEYWCTTSNGLGNATASVRVIVNCKYKIYTVNLVSRLLHNFIFV